VSVALFDLGQRLRSATLGCPVARAAFAPVLPPVDPIAVMVTGGGEDCLVHATDGPRLKSANGPTALSALTDLDVTPGPDPRTLVVANRDALTRLHELAHATDPTSANTAAAAVVNWWAQRADHPGTGAVLDLVTACSARWTLGVPPAHEREIVVWRQWLGVADRGPRGLLDLARRVSREPTLHGLTALVEDDRASWDMFTARLADARSNWDWRRRDRRREAALGLASRCDATELYSSLRLGDPLVATRESFAGSVVCGVVSAVAGRVVEVTTDQLACRLREHNAIEGFPGRPMDLPPALTASPLLRGELAATRVDGTGRLVITIDSSTVRPTGVGQRLTLRPRSVDPRQQRGGRQELHRRYAARRSWLSGGAAPTPRRREVPLDVVVAAAE
jgi:hypothetical protein